MPNGFFVEFIEKSVVFKKFRDLNFRPSFPVYLPPPFFLFFFARGFPSPRSLPQLSLVVLARSPSSPRCNPSQTKWSTFSRDFDTRVALISGKCVFEEKWFENIKLLQFGSLELFLPFNSVSRYYFSGSKRRKK